MASSATTNFQTLRTELRDISQRFGLVAIYAFGSRSLEIADRVRGHWVDPAPGSADSDVDIGIVPTIGVTLSARDRVHIMHGLEALFGVDRVDLVVLPEASTFLALDAVTGELLHALDPEAEAEYQLYVFRAAADLAEWEQERRRLIAAREAM